MHNIEMNLVTRILLVIGFSLHGFVPFGLFHSSAFAQANSTQVKKPSQVLILGDSLSAEYGLPRNSGWVQLLQNELKKQASAVKINNASISGETTSGGLSRLPALLNQKPDLVIIELGANDGLRGLPIEQIEQNLRNMIQQSKKSGAQVLLLGMRIPTNYGPEYTQQFYKLFQTVAQSEQIALLPFFLDGIATKPEYFQADRIHPNVDAQAILFKNVLRALEPFKSTLGLKN
jgi:acyl-CoA thioesterase-1